MSWLRPIKEALDAAPGAVDLFLRDDDAGWADARLFALIDVTEGLGLPLDVAVIPRELTPALARRLLQHPVGLHQHGFAHVSHEAHGRPCEFGPSRTAAAIRADLVHGREILDDLLEGAVLPLFTPPWNRCSAATAATLVRLGWALSRESRALPLGVPDLLELPVHVDWHAKRRGVPLTRAEVGAAIAAAMTGGGPVGLLFHHGVMDRDDLGDARRLLELLARHDAVRPVTMTTLLGEVIPCAPS